MPLPGRSAAEGGGSAPIRTGAPTRAGRALAALLLAALALPAAMVLTAQVPEGWHAGARYQREMVPAQRSGFMFCRLRYARVRVEQGGRGWDTDYPMADRNMMTRLGEFTTAPVNSYPDGEPAHAIVEATDPELFQCPFLFGSDIGTAGFDPEERAALQEYFLKGGFLWVDDFWGEQAMRHWLDELGQILPGYAHVVLDADHPLYSSFYFIERVPQIPNIQFWRRSGGETSERGAETQRPTLSGIVDDRGRLMVVMTHNTDIADGMERESEDQLFFERFSPYAYAVAINIAVYAMTR